jgi:hypothetical protein
MNVEIKCDNCGNNFITKFKHRDKKFCNRKCYFEYARKNNILGNRKDNSIREERTCEQCGNTFIERKKHERKLCSDNCRKLWNSKIENKKNRLDKSKEILLGKYGVDSLFKLENFQIKCKNNFNAKYGETHPMYVDLFIDKQKLTIRNNQIKKLIPKLELYNLTLIDEYINNKNKNTSRPYNFKCNTCGNIFSSTILGSGKIPICRKCFPLLKNSIIETVVRDFLNDNNIKHLDNDRTTLNGKEIDLILKDFNLGIEINGNYYHSEIYGEKNKMYHINKTNLCNENNIKLIHIYEDEIILKKEIVISRLSNLLNLNNNRIYARKCVVKEVSKIDSKSFLDDNHLQGNCVDLYRIGLYLNDDLVSIMTFGKKRNSLGCKIKNNNDFELIRFCNKINTNVVGSFSKLLKNFIKTYKPFKITTFADIRWSGIDYHETVYHKNGFKFIKNTPPNYWYLKTNNYLHREHRFKYRKDVLVKNGFDKNKTEWEIMKQEGYDRIWDCGSMKFEFFP